MMKKRLISALTLTLIVSALVCSGFTQTRAADTADKNFAYVSDIPDRIIGKRAHIDNKVALDSSPEDDPILIGTESFEKGIGMHCMADNPTYVDFDISGYDVTLFHAWVGIQKTSSKGTFLDWGDIIFYIEADGKEVFRSPAMLHGDQPFEINVDITGVKTLRLGQDNHGNYACDHGVWGDAAICTEKTKPVHKFHDTEETTVNEHERPRPDTLKNGYAYVSDLAWMSSNALAGTSVTRDGNNNGGETIYSPDLLVYAKGVGMHACDNNFGSYVELDISDYGFTKFASRIGMVITLSSYNITMSDAVFAVFGDGRELYRSDLIKYMDLFQTIEVDVTGVRTLRLAVSGGASISGDWCAWANALLSISGDVESLFRTDGVLIYDANAADLDDTESDPGSATDSSEPTATASDTSAPTEEASCSPTDTTGEMAVTTVAVTASGTDDSVSTAPETGASGCSSVLGAGSVCILAAVAATAAGIGNRKNREDENR